MANTEAPQPKRNEPGTSWLPVLVALGSVAVFLGWLATRQPTETGVAVAEPGQNAATDENAVTGTVIEPADLNEQGGRPLVGQDIELSSVPVTSALGAHLMWIELPGGSPYLVRLDSTLLARGTSVPVGRRARIVGRVEVKDDAVLADWERAGVLQDPGHRLQAEFGTTYLLARRIDPVAN
jgi:hypothetical protein